MPGWLSGGWFPESSTKPTPFYPIWFYFWVETVGAVLLFGVA